MSEINFAWWRVRIIIIILFVLITLLGMIKSCNAATWGDVVSTYDSLWESGPCPYYYVRQMFAEVFKIICRDVPEQDENTPAVFTYNEWFSDVGTAGQVPGCYKVLDQRHWGNNCYGDQIDDPNLPYITEWQHEGYCLPNEIVYNGATGPNAVMSTISTTSRKGEVGIDCTQFDTEVQTFIINANTCALPAVLNMDHTNMAGYMNIQNNRDPNACVPIGYRAMDGGCDLDFSCNGSVFSRTFTAGMQCCIYEALVYDPAIPLDKEMGSSSGDIVTGQVYTSSNYENYSGSSGTYYSNAVVSTAIGSGGTQNQITNNYGTSNTTVNNVVTYNTYSGLGSGNSGTGVALSIGDYTVPSSDVTISYDSVPGYSSSYTIGDFTSLATDFNTSIMSSPLIAQFDLRKFSDTLQSSEIRTSSVFVISAGRYGDLYIDFSSGYLLTALYIIRAFIFLGSMLVAARIVILKR